MGNIGEKQREIEFEPIEFPEIPVPEPTPERSPEREPERVPART